MLLADTRLTTAEQLLRDRRQTQAHALKPSQVRGEKALELGPRRLPSTEGEILFGRVGVEAGTGRFSAGVNAMLPISQNLNSGIVEANYRLWVNLNYSL